MERDVTLGTQTNENSHRASIPFRFVYLFYIYGSQWILWKPASSSVPQVLILLQHCPKHANVLWCIAVAPGHQLFDLVWLVREVAESDGWEELRLDLFHSTSWLAVWRGSPVSRAQSLIQSHMQTSPPLSQTDKSIRYRQNVLSSAATTFCAAPTHTHMSQSLILLSLIPDQVLLQRSCPSDKWVSWSNLVTRASFLAPCARAKALHCW